MEDTRERNIKSENIPAFNQSNRPVNRNKEMEGSSAGPKVLLLWVWNWVATIPKALTHFYSDLKSGEFLARFTLLDAMMQFIVAIATSCHPQEDGVFEKHDSDERKTNRNETAQGAIKTYGCAPFTGKGRTLQSGTVKAN